MLKDYTLSRKQALDFDSNGDIVEETKPTEA